ncbi:MAG: protein translocase subunit SecD [Phycisphaerales bacterium]
MSRNLVPKIILILILVAAAILSLYPPSKTLKPGIDLAGGTSLIYAIDTQGLSSSEEKDLAQRMITVLRRRIDPSNIQNLVWRPQGNTRFEIQMPLASKETQAKRDIYLAALNDLLDKNINPAVILRALQLPSEQRTQEIAQFAQGDPNRVEALNKLSSLYDERMQLQAKRDASSQAIQTIGEQLAAAQVNLERVQANRGDWIKLSGDAQRKALVEFLGAETHADLLTSYVNAYKDLGEASEKLTAEGGLNEQYDLARRQLDRLNLSEEQITAMLGMKPADRSKKIEELQSKFADRKDAIGRVVAAFQEYSPYRGRLDDPADLKRMLKGAGILEFRILPTADRGEPSAAEIERYVEDLKEKGPRTASDNRYKWVQIESMDEWKVPTSIVGQFGDNYYVLASNQPNEVMLHGPGSPDWKLDSSYPTNDDVGRRAIGFTLNIKGGDLFYNVTSKNANRPLAILLDNVAVSAPNINEGGIRQRGIIQGTFTPTEIQDMVNKLNAGSLPGRLIEQPISERVIGPSVGADNLQKGIRSGIIGLIVVAGFMLVYYAIGGSIADVALLLNILFVLAIMAQLRATFTLPGIAGLILTIGMSVDANVLIFERIREEQEKGLGLATAIRNGYGRAFSAIFDSNLTTILTAAILYYVAAEDIKGFAIVLMLGIGSSMFTAIFVTRVILDFLVSKRILKNRLVMLRLISVPSINWMGMRKVFYVISGVFVVMGLTVFFARGNSKYDIEFTGGTSVQISLKEGVSLTRQNVEDQLQAVAQGNADLKAATVYSVGEPTGEAANGEKVYSQYEITTTAINTLRTVATFTGARPSVADATASIRKAEADLSRQIGGFEVAASGDQAYAVATSGVNPKVIQDVLTKAFPSATVAESDVQAVVTDAIRQAFKGQLEIQQNLNPAIASAEKITDQVVDTYPELADYIGGIRIETTLQTAATLPEINLRLKDLRFRPDTQNIAWYPYKILGPGFKAVEPNQPLSSFTFVSVEPEAGLRELTDEEWQSFVENEKSRVLLATQRETSLPRVTQIDPFVGSEAKTRALISIVLSLAAIVGYIWLRFGTLRFGLAAIACLFHDVSIALGAIAVSALLAKSIFGQALLISDFRINGAMIAAILTLLGYSLNDTIVVFDRIRENRRKAQLTPQSVTNSINETLSRTIITGLTTLFVVAVMYVFGGSGLRGFNYVILVGLIVGTYSSIAIAAPLLLVNLPGAEQDKARHTAKIENISTTHSKVKTK